MKKIIDLLAIILPALLLVMGLWGLPSFIRKKKPASTSAKTNMLNLVKMLFLIVLLFIGIVRFLFSAVMAPAILVRNPSRLP